MQKPQNASESNINGTDLIKLAEMLRENGFCNNPYALDNAGQNFNKTSNQKEWSYDISFLDFSIDKVGSTLPSIPKDVSLRFSIKANGVYTDSNGLQDPLKNLNFNFEIIGVCQDARNMYCSWHLDRHDDTGNAAKYSHPFYHLTFGGNKMEEKEFNGTKLDFGNIIIMPSPRICYPPMDAILGIDFILQNFFHKSKTKKILSDSDYRTMIRKSQDYLWRPFYVSIGSYWNPTKSMKALTNAEFTPQKLFPFLM